ncbi:Tripartite tricarboxylate transporter TctB family protein [Lentibacillus halodurans]|uniref:Tripartite tricarboxylate transporter TctB family protein n=1 Tax=Lentibacillus halodurans TaxID=237679 RepID=A0A1I1AED4_9BACI|nr:tripartite tricarboxylate transporter TctB family protein [Lentibacillus halodurans]SFB36354.1 Tripartite tricarboxylate transporter TctB family protein [Lentibacillus halodurans]
MSILLKYTIASGSILVFVSIFFIESLKLPDTAARLPQIVIVLIAILAIAMFIQAFIEHKKATNTNEQVEKENINVKRVFLFGISIALYIFFLDIIGYFILTPIFSFGVFMYLRATNVILAFILSIGFTAFVYAVFNLFLNIPIPMGVLS